MKGVFVRFGPFLGLLLVTALFAALAPDRFLSVYNLRTVAMQATAVCDDCVVSFVASREPGDAVVIDVAAERAVRMLSRAGLVPELRHLLAAALLRDANDQELARFRRESAPVLRALAFGVAQPASAVSISRARHQSL